MGLISQYVETKVNNRNKKHYKQLGYDVSKHNGHSSITIMVSVNDISKCSFTKVDCQCDYCGRIYPLNYSDYYRRNHDGKIYCNNCAHAVSTSGENNNRWNPYLTEDDRTERRIKPEYYEFTRKILQRDCYTCCCCNQQGHNLEVHHLNGYNWDVNGRLDFSNAVTLCKVCHDNFHNIYGRGNNTKQQFEEWIGHTVEYQKEYAGELFPTRKIICLDDNIVFNNPKEAAEYANSIPSQILKCCLMKESIKYGQYTKSIHGKHYIYLDDYNKMSKQELDEYLEWCNELKTYNNPNNINPNSKSVVCVNTKTVYKSCAQVCDIFKLSSGGLSECCNHKKQHCGRLSNGERLQWMFLSEYLELYGSSDLIYYE